MMAEICFSCGKGPRRDLVERMTRWPFLAFVTLALLTGCQTTHEQPSFVWPKYRLLAAQTTALNLPGGIRFDASGLLLLSSGEMLTMRNNHDSLLYRIDYLAGGQEADLVPFNDCFATDKLDALAGDKHSFDCEGIALDEQGRFYMCEERRRWILRCDPRTGKTERLPIDWSRVKDYFSAVDSNASFEGIAIGKGKLYVANERSSAIIIVVDLASLRVKDHFVVQPTKASFFGLHYSDLCWFEDKLWVLCRQHRVVLQVDPDTHRVLAEYDFGNLEESLGYRTGLPVGIMEGLVVTKDSIWLVTDNNGDPRGRTGNDTRPTLVRCVRPDKK
jgi:hypothetical protein